MIDLEGMTTQEKLALLEHVIQELQVMIDNPDTDEIVVDSLRCILEGGEAWGCY